MMGVNIMAKELEKVYNPSSTEDRLYKFWTENKYFHAEVDPKKDPYTIVIPPPNINSLLRSMSIETRVSVTSTGVLASPSENLPVSHQSHKP